MQQYNDIQSMATIKAVYAKAGDTVTLHNSLYLTTSRCGIEDPPTLVEYLVIKQSWSTALG